MLRKGGGITIPAFQGHYDTIGIAVFILIGFFFLAYHLISLEIFLAIVAIAISVIIAYRQELQLRKISDIGTQTKDLALKQQSDSTIRDNLEKFFFISRVKHKNKKFKIVFPVYFQEKPLPLLNQGDFYAIHIITSRISEDLVELIQVYESTPDHDFTSDPNPVIFICAPQANRFLEKSYQFQKITDDASYEQLKQTNWPLDPLGLPCWFVEDNRKAWSQRSIYVNDLTIPGRKTDLLPSPAEVSYIQAKNQKTGFHHPTLINDYAIFGRITINDKEKTQRFFLAGIHQYGTWIAAKLLRNIINNTENLPYRPVFSRPDDFIGIIEGRFNVKTLDIADNDIRVVFNYLWVKDKGTWKKVDLEGNIMP